MCQVDRTPHRCTLSAHGLQFQQPQQQLLQPQQPQQLSATSSRSNVMYFLNNHYKYNSSLQPVRGTNLMYFLNNHYKYDSSLQPIRGTYLMYSLPQQQPRQQQQLLQQHFATNSRY